MTRQRSKNFAERLVAQQHVDEALRLRYRQHLDASFERTMTPWERNKSAIEAIACVGFIAFFGYLAVVRKDFSAGKRSISAALIALSALFAWIRIRQFRRGTINARTDLRSRRWVQVGAMFVAVFAVARLGSKSADPLHSLVVLVGLALLGVILMGIQMRMLFAELRTKMEEQNLELQYRLAELAERLEEIPSVDRRRDS